MIRTVHIAKYVLAEAGLLLRNAAVHVCDPGRVSRLEPWQSPPPNLETKVVDWGSAIILPGLVNTHCHIELTRPQCDARRPASFADWLSFVAGERKALTNGDYLEAVSLGAEMSLAGGTTLIGAVSSRGASWEALKAQQLRKVIFEEVATLEPDRANEAVSALQLRLSRLETDGYLSFSVAPHAPYSVSPELFRALAGLVSDKGVRLATRVAETRQELEFLKTGLGEFKDYLSGSGVLPEGWEPPGLAPVPYLEQLGILDHPAILVHCNYLDEESMARILSRNCSVVYCPRSHAFFRHELHPVRQLLDIGINVALGTDSPATCDSLSILDEMRFLFQNRKDLKADEIVRMATLNGAVALGFGGVLGRLRRGYWADMTVLRLPENVSDRNVLAQVLEGAGECLATIVQGETVWTKSPQVH